MPQQQFNSITLAGNLPGARSRWSARSVVRPSFTRSSVKRPTFSGHFASSLMQVEQ